MTGVSGAKLGAEFVGTALLVATVIGSGIMATRLMPENTGLQLLANSLATGAALVALILTLQPVSAAFNPAVTTVEAIFGVVSWRSAALLVAAQLTGGAVGAVLANCMFDLSPVSISSLDRTGAGQWLGEVVATFGLVLVVFGGLRGRRADTLAFAVGGYITAAYWFTSSTSFANPAVTAARTLSDSFAGIAPTSVPMFIVMQFVGAAGGALAVRILFPRPTGTPQ